MKLSDVDRVRDLGERRRALVEAHEKCRPNSVSAHGDWWFVAYNYRDEQGEDHNRLRIPASVVCDLVEKQLAEIDRKLRDLGVFP